MFTEDGWTSLIDTIHADCDGKTTCKFHYDLIVEPNLSEACQDVFNQRIYPNGPI